MLVKMKRNSKEMRSIKITIKLLRYLGMWPAETEREKLLYNTYLAIAVLSTVVAVFMRVLECYHFRSDLQELIQVIPISAVVFSEFAKLIVFIVNRQKVLNLNKFTNDNFWQKRLDAKETEVFNDCDRLCYKTILFYVISVQAVCWKLILKPLAIAIFLNEKTLPYNLHFEILSKEPYYYGFTYAFQIFATISPVLCTTVFATYMFTMNCFLANQFEMLGMKLESLGRNRSRITNEEQQITTYEKLKEHVEEHKMLIDYANEMEYLFCYIMLGQALASILQICCSSLQILLAGSFTSAKTYTSIVYLIAALVQLYFYCYSSHKVYEKSEKLSTALYFSKWFEITNSKIRKDYARLVQMMMLRARRPCILTIGKLYPLTLGTFASILGSSMSFFTVLRQTMDR